MARLLLGVSGGVACYKAVELVRLATAAGHAVRVVQTPASLRFVGRATLAAVSAAPVLVSEFEQDPDRGAFPGEARPSHTSISHLEVAHRCDAYIVYPATANTLAKLANGLADNLLTSAALATTAPMVIAPAMNNHMYEHSATQANIATLRSRGVRIVEPEIGPLASFGEWGIGRLAPAQTVLDEAERVLGAPTSVLSGRRVCVTAGGTHEPIDPVRYIGNRSSGLMGFSLAEEFARRGAVVTVISANVGLARRPGIVYRDVETSAELERALFDLFSDTDILVMAAAVSDFRPARPEQTKLERSSTLDLRLEATADILAALAAERSAGQTIVGFAAEQGDAIERAQAKLVRKGLDAIVVNDISQPGIGFDAPDNEVTFVTAGGAEKLARGPKQEVSRAVCDALERLLVAAGQKNEVAR